MTASALTAATGDCAPDRLVEVLDRLIERGVVIRAELWLGVADVDLVFLGADVILTSADRMARLRGASSTSEDCLE